MASPSPQPVDPQPGGRPRGRGRIKQFWQRVTNGLQLNQLWDQFRSETRRLVLLSDVPWTPHSPATCLVAAGANQGTCMTTEPASRIAGHAAPATIARATHVQYLDVANLLCDQWRCPAVIDGLIPTYDGIHLTPQYSAFIAPALGPALNLAGTRTVPITAVAISSS